MRFTKHSFGNLAKQKVGFLTIIFLLLPYFAFGVSDSIVITLPVSDTCNSDGVCDSGIGEDSSNCPLDCPTTPPPPGGGGGGVAQDATPPIIFNLLVERMTLNSASISWTTNEMALCKLFLGKTSEYEKESFGEVDFSLQHNRKIVNLFPDTVYHFKIECQDTNKNKSETSDQKFSTLTPPDITPPANIINFEALSGDSQATLKWQNPPDADFQAVKILRSAKFYPQNIWEGELVYDYKGNSFVDTGLTNGKRYYYTAFAYDKNRNYASGATASAVPQKPLPPGVPPPVIPPPPEEIPPVVPPPPEIEKINLKDFDFLQEGKKIIPVAENQIPAKLEKPLNVSLNYEKVPEVLKTIMVTLKKGAKSFSFLLRINKEKTAYTASLIPPQEAGTYPMTITILDYKNQTLKKINGQLEVKQTEAKILKISWYQKIKNWTRQIWLEIKQFFGSVFLYLKTIF